MPKVDDDLAPLPVARTVRDDMDLDKKFLPVTGADVTDEKLMVGEFRAFRRETRDVLSSIVEALKAFTSIDAKLDVIIDRQNHLDDRITRAEERQDAADQRAVLVDARLTALETSKTKGRKPARKKR